MRASTGNSDPFSIRVRTINSVDTVLSVTAQTRVRQVKELLAQATAVSHLFRNWAYVSTFSVSYTRADS